MQEYAHCWFIGKILKNINLVNMKKLMLFLLLLFSINVTAQNVVDSVSVAETNDGKQLWGKTFLIDDIYNLFLDELELQNIPSHHHYME